MSVSVNQSHEVGPLTLSLEPDEVVLRLLGPKDIYLAVPPSLENELVSFAERHAAGFKGKTLVFDLAGVQGLSSRHLGILVTAQKAFRSRGGCVLRGVCPELKRLLQVTQIVQLFTLEGE